MMTAAAYGVVRTPSHTGARRLQGETCCVHGIDEENEAEASLAHATLHGGFKGRGTDRKDFTLLGLAYC